MKLSFLIYTALLLNVCVAIPCAYGQKDPTDTLPLPKSGSVAQANEIYFDALKAKMHDDVKKSEQLFLQFVAIDPNVPAAYYELSKLSYGNKKIDDANTYIKKALTLDSSNKWYKEQYASILADKGSFSEAAEIMASLANAEPDDRTYPLMAAEYYGQAHQFEQAISYLDMATDRYGPDEEVIMLKVQLYLNMNNVEKAANAMKELIAQDPDNGKYYKRLADLYDNNKLPAKANEVYKDAQKKLPGNPYIQLGIAEHYLKAGDSVSYMAYERKAIINKDLDADTQLDLLKKFSQSMPNDSVLKLQGLPIIREIVAQHPADAMALAFYGDFLDIDNDHDSAVIAFKNSVRITPSNFSVWESLLRDYTGPKDADSLIKYSEKAMHLFPNLAIVNYYNSIGHYNKKEYPVAIKAINRAIDMQPDDNHVALVRMYAFLAEIYHASKQDDLSDQAYDKALKIDPNDAGVLNDYSYYLSERGAKIDVAEQMSKKSLEISPDEASFLDTYGWILYKKGDYEKAKEYVIKAISHAGANADATLYSHLGNIYYKLNDKDNAIKYWKMAKEKGSDDPQLDKKINEGKLYE